MTPRFHILGSSSSGNCAFLQTENCKVLIDAGFSGRRTAEMLEEIGEKPDHLDAIFITHEHSDHINGLRGLSKWSHLRLFANPFTAEASRRNLRRSPEWTLFESGATLTFRDLRVQTFSIPHDSHDPVGYVFSTGGDDLFKPLHRIGWVLDLGYAPESVKERIRSVDTLVIEANHDRHLLRVDTKRPWSVKQRISGRHGHLSNEASCQLLEEVGERGASWKEVILGHLSGDCNSMAAVQEAFATLLQNPERNFPLRMVDGNGKLHDL